MSAASRAAIHLSGSDCRVSQSDSCREWDTRTSRSRRSNSFCTGAGTGWPVSWRRISLVPCSSRRFRGWPRRGSRRGRDQRSHGGSSSHGARRRQSRQSRNSIASYWWQTIQSSGSVMRRDHFRWESSACASFNSRCSCASPLATSGCKIRDNDRNIGPATVGPNSAKQHPRPIEIVCVYIARRRSQPGDGVAAAAQRVHEHRRPERVDQPGAGVRIPRPRI